MDKLIIYKDGEAPCTGGTFKVGTIYGASYDQLWNYLGEPTIDSPSGDDKTQVEWVVEFNDELFTIYDWKTYDRHYTKNSLTTWSIGGKSSGLDLSDYIESQIKELELPF